MDHRTLIILAGLTALGSGAEAAPAITPPLSHYGPLASPILQRGGLSPPVRQAVAAAIAVAAQANATAAQAEKTVAAAERAAGDGRAAVGKVAAPGHGVRILAFDHSLCRYRGELAGGQATGLGMLTCGEVKFTGRFRNGRPDGLAVRQDPAGGYMGEFKNGAPEGLGGDYSNRTADAYEGEYRQGARLGPGVERDRDGVYPGQYGFHAGAANRRTNMELLGLQDFRGLHWAGRYGAYAGPRIACVLIKGAVLEGSVLDGPGAKFDARGRLIEQGRYHLGVLEKGRGAPC